MSTIIPSTMKAYVLKEFSGSLDDVHFEDVPVPTISDDEILIKNKYSGLNFIDKYMRTGAFMPAVPSVIGTEASGEVVSVGKNVTDYAVGDLVSYGSLGSYAEYTKVSPSLPMTFVYKLPPGSSDEMLKFYGALMGLGLTAVVLTAEAYNVQKGDYILIQAAAGGVGSMMAQVIKKKGAHVIGVASSEEKLKYAKECGAEFTINSKTEDVVARVMEITNGQGVQGCFDGVGADTFETSFASMGRKGTFVCMGQASGPIPPFDLARLLPKNIKIVKPSLYFYLSTKEEWDHYTSVLKDLVDGGLKAGNMTVYPFTEYKKGAIALEGRQTTGKLLLDISTA